MDALEVAERIAMELERRGQDYALGGAIALGYWAQPRGTLDVDITLFVPADRPSECVWLLQEIGCELQASAALVLHAQRERLDRQWVRTQLDAIFGEHDPRLSAWDELCQPAPPEPKP